MLGSAPELPHYCRKNPFQDSERGLTIRNELSRETHMLTKQGTLLGRGTRAERSRVGNPGELLSHVAHSFRFYGDGISFRVVSGQLFWPGSFLVVQALLSQGECQQEGFWEVVWHVVSPFDLSWTLPVGCGLLVPGSLLGPPVIK